MMKVEIRIENVGQMLSRDTVEIVVTGHVKMAEEIKKAIEYAVEKHNAEEDYWKWEIK